MNLRVLVLSALTGRDNTTIDVGRVLWAGSMGTLCALEAHATFYLHQQFDPVAFANACGIVLGAGGVAVAVKGHTEPEPRS